MRLFSFICVAEVLAVFSCFAAARADNDISPRVVGGQIATYGYDDDATLETPTALRVFDFGFDPAVDPNSTTDPGIHALSTDFAATFGTAANHIVASGFPNGSKIAFDVVSDLKLWNGASFAPSPMARNCDCHSVRPRSRWELVQDFTLDYGGDRGRSFWRPRVSRASHFDHGGWRRPRQSGRWHLRLPNATSPVVGRQCNAIPRHCAVVAVLCALRSRFVQPERSH